MTWCWHKYGKWVFLKTLTIYGDGLGGMRNTITGHSIVQTRECERCGKIKAREVGY